MRGDALVHLDEGRLLRIRIPVDRDQKKERQLRLGRFGDRVHVQRGDRLVGPMDDLAEDMMGVAGHRRLCKYVYSYLVVGERAARTLNVLPDQFRVRRLCCHQPEVQRLLAELQQHRGAGRDPLRQ